MTSALVLAVWIGLLFGSRAIEPAKITWADEASSTGEIAWADEGAQLDPDGR